jgi:hypothetical protein
VSETRTVNVSISRSNFPSPRNFLYPDSNPALLPSILPKTMQDFVQYGVKDEQNSDVYTILPDFEEVKTVNEPVNGSERLKASLIKTVARKIKIVNGVKEKDPDHQRYQSTSDPMP